MEIVPRAIPDAEEQSCLFEMVGLLFRFKFKIEFNLSMINIFSFVEINNG